jgi:hypothetical protein
MAQEERARLPQQRWALRLEELTPMTSGRGAGSLPVSALRLLVLLLLPRRAVPSPPGGAFGGLLRRRRLRVGQAGRRAELLQLAGCVPRRLLAVGGCQRCRCSLLHPCCVRRPAAHHQMRQGASVWMHPTPRRPRPRAATMESNVLRDLPDGGRSPQVTHRCVNGMYLALFGNLGPCLAAKNRILFQ